MSPLSLLRLPVCALPPLSQRKEPLPPCSRGLELELELRYGPWYVIRNRWLATGWTATAQIVSGRVDGDCHHMVGPHLSHKHAHTPIRVDEAKFEAMFMFACANVKGYDKVSYVFPLCLCQRNLHTSFGQRASGQRASGQADGQDVVLHLQSVCRQLNQKLGQVTAKLSLNSMDELGGMRKSVAVQERDASVVRKKGVGFCVLSKAVRCLIALSCLRRAFEQLHVTGIH